MRAILDPAAAWRQEAGAERRQGGRRGTGASEARSPRSGRALDGPPDRWSTPAPRGAKLADGVRGHRKRGARAAGEHWTGPRIVGRRRRRQAPSWPTGYGARGGSRASVHPEPAQRASTGRTPGSLVYGPLTGSQPRVITSLMVSAIRMASQKKPPPATTQMSPELSRRCMKKTTTRSALVNAIVSATTTLSGPRSTYETPTVASVRKTSAANTAT